MFCLPPATFLFFFFSLLSYKNATAWLCVPTMLKKRQNCARNNAKPQRSWAIKLHRIKPSIASRLCLLLSPLVIRAPGTKLRWNVVISNNRVNAEGIASSAKGCDRNEAASIVQRVELTWR